MVGILRFRDLRSRDAIDAAFEHRIGVLVKDTQSFRQESTGNKLSSPELQGKFQICTSLTPFDSPPPIAGTSTLWRQSYSSIERLTVNVTDQRSLTRTTAGRHNKIREK